MDLTPPRLDRAVHSLRALEAEGLHFAPIRHHSPACATAVRQLIADVGPSTVLIEGPEEYTVLVPELARPETVPPVAILSTAGATAGNTGFFPMAAYSPEWVALREGLAVGAEVAFIDRSWTDRPEPDETDDPDALLLSRSIQSERYLTHSRALADLARREHCRDQDELWDHLFEVRRPAARTLLDEVLAWAALARVEYEPEVLSADGTLAREAVMAARIAEHRTRASGPVVVVTGAFHTLALIEALTGDDQGAVVRELIPADGFPAPASAAGTAWLIRFDNRRLDAMSGYGAGMPAPGYYERVWAAGDADPTEGILLDLAAGIRAADTTERVGVADVASARVAVTRLADLRGRARPGRTDVLDAIASTFIKGQGEGTSTLQTVLRDIFVGDRLGEVPSDTAAPPVVAEARARALAAKLRVADSASRSVSLDLRRKPAHRARSRFLSLMEFVGAGFATRVGGPDLIGGHGLGRLFEEWTYAWTPLVEARLIDLTADGASLDEIAAAHLARRERALAEAPGTPSSAVAVELLAQAATIGMHDELPRLAVRVDAALDADPVPASVVAAAFRLFALVRSRDELELGDATEILALLERAVAALAFLVPQLGSAPADEDDAIVGLLIDLRALTQRIDAEAGLSPEPILRELDRLRLDPETSPAVAGAVTGLAAIEGTDDPRSALSGRLAPGADVDRAVRFLGGFMRAAPDLILRDPVLLEAVQGGVRALDSDAFLAYLPELRRAFSWLKPVETAALAERITGGSGLDLAVVRHDLTADDLQAGVAAQRALAASLRADGLGIWAGEPS